MGYIRGKVRVIIYEAESNYKVGVLKVKETNDKGLEEFLGKSLHFTGYFGTLQVGDNYEMEGNLIYKEKYGYQYNVTDYKKMEVTGYEAVIEFLTSDLIKGCGEATAKRIVDTLGNDAIKKIKEDKSILMTVPKMSEKKALKIYSSIMSNSSVDDDLIKLKEMGFSINEALNIINKFQKNALSIAKTNPYALKEIIDFKKLDNIYLSGENPDETLRVKNCVLETIRLLEIRNGDTYFYLEEIRDGLKTYFNIVDVDYLEEVINSLESNKDIYREEKRIYLNSTYSMEVEIAKKLNYINSLPITGKNISMIDTEIEKLEEKLDVTYDTEQKTAIKRSLENRISIITGGPGTGKTTIIKAITSLYMKMYNLSPSNVNSYIALLAPTGRASKRLSEATNLGASTIHKYLKWNKDMNEFQVDEFNQNYQRLIIIDEVSMIDTNLMYHLLLGLTNTIQIILVGDKDQLPSVGCGLVLKDLIDSDLFNFCPLETIHRQSENSYIPYLAKEIKNKDITSDFLSKKDDYNFLRVDNSKVLESISRVCELSIKRGHTDKDIQVLAPIYKGINGIDNLNNHLRDLFNPKSDKKREIKIGDITFRVGDKVLQLVNDPERGIYNGDIGYIDSIVSVNNTKTLNVNIDFDGNLVSLTTGEMINVRLAYAISIHKAQGSEFVNVIMPVCSSYYKMLYNKLIYTGVSRAKKSLMLVGNVEAFLMGVNNNYSMDRKTSLKDQLLKYI